LPVVAGVGVIGRDAELSAVDDLLEHAECEVRALALEGDAGIGKSTIWEEARRRAEARGATVLWCRPADSEAKFSFSGLTDLLAPVDEAAWTALASPQREALEVALLRAAPRAGAPITRAVAVAFLVVIRTLAARAPLVVAVDDLQWLDSPSRGVLEFALRRLESEHVAVLYTRRIPSQVPGLERALAPARLTRLPLKPLSLAVLARIVSSQLGMTLPRPVMVRIRQAVGGNPFYALETARLVIESAGQQSPGAQLPVPDDLMALAARRSRGLPSETRTELLLAAVLSNPDTKALDLETLGPAEEAQIIRIDDRGRIEFTHPLFASAAYGSLSRAQRRDVHRRAAGLVRDPEQRARHLALGSDRPQHDTARGLDDAAALARARGAPDAAAELLELAAARTPSPDLASRAGRLLRAARLHMDTADLTRAERLAQQVLSSSPGPGTSAEALQLIAQVRARQSGFLEANELASRALSLAAGDDRLAAEIELDLGFYLVSLGDFGGAAPHAHAALTHAQASGDEALLGDALAGLSVMEFLAGRGLVDGRIERALTLEDPARVRTFIMRPTGIHGMLQLWTGQLRRAVETLSALHEETIERGQEGVAPLLSLYLVWASLWRGDFEQATRFAAESDDACDLIDDAMLNATSLCGGALLHAHLGPPDRAREEAREAMVIFERLQWRSGLIWPCWALGLAELADGDPAQAHAVLGPLADQLEAIGVGDPVLAMFLPDEIEALIGVGELEAAERHLQQFEGLARVHRRPWAIAAALRCRGALEASRGLPEQAFEAFQLALAEYEKIDMPFERARTLMLAGQVRRRVRQRGLARELLTEAADVFERLGAEPWRARAQEDLARLGRRGSAGDELTAGERRVAELVASGHSNREVAELAFLSVKTVEATLTRVYRKLGVRSRVGLTRELEGRREP
jgi:DNA-binding CsgD family transcriptional regulator